MSFDPGPDGSAHLFGDHEYDLAQDQSENPNADAPPERAVYFNANCRYATKRAYVSTHQADLGAEMIRAQVEFRGAVYGQLYPYLCPDGNHWHLSHRRQSQKVCPVCRQKVGAWQGDSKDPRDGPVWVINAHMSDGERCQGELSNVR